LPESTAAKKIDDSQDIDGYASASLDIEVVQLNCGPCLPQITQKQQPGSRYQGWDVSIPTPAALTVCLVLLLLCFETTAPVTWNTSLFQLLSHISRKLWYSLCSCRLDCGSAGINSTHSLASCLKAVENPDVQDSEVGVA